MNTRRGIVYLVGAGPGDPGLITLKGWRLLREAHVIVHDRLIPHELLLEARHNAEIIAVGKEPGRHTMPQEEINALLVDRARRGSRVVRLKGGDPFVFGRGFEELAACRDAAVDCVVVPGVTSAIAAPAAAGIPVTHRQLARSLAIITGKTGDDTGAPEIDFNALAGIDTVCFLMGRENLHELTNGMIRAGRSPALPAACIEWGTTPRQRVSIGTLGTIANIVEHDDLKAPMVCVIGDVAGLAVGNQRQVAGPLVGKRILVTRSHSANDELGRALTARGATPIHCPLIRIRYSNPNGELKKSLARVGAFYDWIVFTSVHGVIGFYKMLFSCGLDLRILGNSISVAAVGPATARALKMRGIKVDFMPSEFTAAHLAETMVELCATTEARIFFPRGSAARMTWVENLRNQFQVINDVVVYNIDPILVGSELVSVVTNGVDAVTFYSPSAVRSWTEQTLNPGRAVIACLGPTTTSEADAAGMRVDVMAEPHTSRGLVDALERYFAEHRA